MTSYDTKESIHTWNTIAQSFDKTRQNPWEPCLKYINNLPKQILAADFGCGNGRHLIPLSKHCAHVIGLDISIDLLHITQHNLIQQNLPSPQLINASLPTLPLKDSCVDAALFIASLHNIKGKTYRSKALQEIYRVLKPKGTVLISVWSQEQERFRNHINKHNEKDNIEPGDIYINWNKDSLHIPRFYHLYQKDEFSENLYIAGFTILSLTEECLASKKYPDNYFAVVQKDQ